MKYSRYDIKSNKKKKDDWRTTILLMLGVVVLAIAIGSLIFFKVIPREGTDKNSGKPNTENNANQKEPKNDTNIPPVAGENEETKPEETEKEEKQNTDFTTYTMVQCGYFSSQESATTAKNQVGQSAKVLKDGEKFRVVTFIGTEEEALKKSEELTSASIDNTKTRFNIPTTDLCDKELVEMLNGTIKILNQLNQADVKSVNTTEFKKWTNELKEETDAKNFEIFKSFKEKINALPDEINSTHEELVYQMNYEVINNFK